MEQSAVDHWLGEHANELPVLFAGRAFGEPFELRVLDVGGFRPTEHFASSEQALPRALELLSEVNAVNLWQADGSGPSTKAEMLRFGAALKKAMWAVH